MSTANGSPGVIRRLEWILAFVGAANCIVVPFLFASGQSQLFPLPGLYFMEIALLGTLGLVSVATDPPVNSRWPLVPWLVAGALSALVVLGGFSIGFFLIPAAATFLLTGTLMDWRLDGPGGRHLGLAAVTAIVQGGLMLLLTMVS